MASFPGQPKWTGTRKVNQSGFKWGYRQWGWQWHQLDHMQTVCTSLQTDNHISTSSLNFLLGRYQWVKTESVTETCESSCVLAARMLARNFKSNISCRARTWFTEAVSVNRRSQASRTPATSRSIIPLILDLHHSQQTIIRSQDSATSHSIIPLILDLHHSQQTIIGSQHSCCQPLNHTAHIWPTHIHHRS